MGVNLGDDCHKKQHVLVIEDVKENSAIESSLVNLDDGSKVRSSPSPRKKRTPAKKWYAEARKWENLPCRKRSGVRNMRREENLSFLMDIGGEADLCDFAEVVEPHNSSFSELFMEQEKMRAWNDFINWSEDEQERLIKGGNVSSWQPCCNDDGPEADDTDGTDCSQSDVSSTNSWLLIDDHRAVHPGYSAEECFRRIHHNLKTVLRNRHLPLGKLMDIEKDVTDFFTDCPTAVYVSRLASSYERLLLHCLCQYLNLKSHSVDCDGYRQTEVENQYTRFIPPDVTLSRYLEMRRS